MSFTERLYRLLVRLYPRELRGYEDDMWAVVARRRGRLGAQSRRWCTVRLWVFIVRDLARTLPATHLAEWRGKRLAHAAQRSAQRIARNSRGRDMRGWIDAGSWIVDLSDVARDVKYAVRSLARNPRFTLTAVVILGLGIGANTTIFSVVDAVYFDDAPHVTAPEDLVRLYGASRFPPTSPFYSQASPLDYPDFGHYRDTQDAFTDLAGYDVSTMALTIIRSDARSDGTASFVSDNYFDVLGLQPEEGRWFLPEEGETEGDHLVAVISHGLWSRMFDANPSVIGQRVQLNGRGFTVVGVTPEDFRGLSPLEAAPDVWLPLPARFVIATWPGPIWTRQDGRQLVWIVGVGRLREGVTVEAAQDRMEAMSLHLEQEFPASYEREPRLYDARFEPADGASLGTMTRLLLVVVAVVLLIACANLAILMLARGSARARNFAVRVALGAARRRIVREALTESFVLALLGGAVGIGIAYVSSGVVGSILPAEFSVSFAPDSTVLAFGCVLAIVTALLFGMVPAVQAAHIPVTRTLKGHGGGSGRSWARGALVVAQVALAVSLASAAALTGRSFATATAVPLGYAVDDRILISTNLWNHSYSEPEGQAFVQAAVERFRIVPGVRSATVELTYPFQGGGWQHPFVRPGAGAEDPLLRMSTNPVGSDFFQTMEIEVLAGRTFDDTDGRYGAPVRVVSETTARNLWPDQDPIGQRVAGRNGQHLWEVVGVVEDTRTADLGSAPELYAYSPFDQSRFAYAEPTFVVHGDIAVGILRTALAEVDPTVAITRIQSVQDAVGRATGRYRTAALFVGLFGSLALGLAMVGLYGVLSYSVVCARQEIGIRMALGASARRVGQSVATWASKLTVLGLLAGGLAMWLGAPLLASFLYGIEPRDAGTWFIAVVAVSAVAAAASTLPALRAARVDPMVALRSE